MPLARDRQDLPVSGAGDRGVEVPRIGGRDMHPGRVYRLDVDAEFNAYSAQVTFCSGRFACAHRASCSSTGRRLAPESVS
jgi:hypothetical protein